MELNLFKGIDIYTIFTHEWEISQSKGSCSYIKIRYKNEKHLEQGYKIHISSSINSANKILKSVIPILKEEKVSFKFLSSIEVLINSLSGKCGYTQVAKFITIYPTSEEHFISLALLLHELTKGNKGPHIFNENAIYENSLVHYRYGAFKNMFLQKDKGNIVLAIKNDIGKLVPDSRGYPQNSNNDPFRKRGIKTWVKEYSLLLNNRYAITALLKKNIGKRIWLGLDTKDDNIPLVLIKEVEKHVLVDSKGIDAVDRLKHEADILRYLHKTDLCPQFIDHWDNEFSSYLVYQYIEGISLYDFIQNIREENKKLNESVVKQWGLKLCDLLERIHGKGIIFNDLKTKNIIIDKAANLRIIDFELSTFSTSSLNYGVGTANYFSEEKSNRIKAGMPSSKVDDIFSFGAVMFSLCTLIDPSTLPANWNYTEYFDKFVTTFSNELKQIIKTCLDIEENKKYLSFKKISNQIKNIKNNNIQKNSLIRKRSLQKKYIKYAFDIGELLCINSFKENDKIWWNSSTHEQDDYPYRNIYNGNSGIGFFLIELFEHSNRQNQKYFDYSKSIATWLLQTDQKIGRKVPLPGLFFGEAGVGLFYLRLHQLTKDSNYLNYALETSNLIYDIKYPSPDLTHGAAGIGLFHLFLTYFSNDTNILNRALDAGDYLLKTKDHDKPLWAIPEEITETAQQRYLGMAHGAAGIGYFLLKLYEKTKVNCYLDTVLDVIDYLTKVSDIQCKASSIMWPHVEDDQNYQPYWCHGATGIGKFFLKAYQLLDENKFVDICEKAAVTVYENSIGMGTTQCHGLAGNIEYLLDMYSITNNDLYLYQACHIGSILESYKVREGMFYKWPSDNPYTFTPDYMLGNAGIGSCFLRLGMSVKEKTIPRDYFIIE